MVFLNVICLATLGSSAVALGTCDISDSDKQDCGHVGSTQSNCESSGCCWQPKGEGSSIPWCFKSSGGPTPPSTCTAKGTPSLPFSDDDVKTIRQYFEANLDAEGSGMVMASPDHNTGSGGSYYYAWQRDGALSMNAYMQTSPNFSDTVEKMEKWIDWVERSVNQDDQQTDIMVEPKYEIPSGKPFSGGWCRPQNDGPGLRAITLMAYAEKKPEIKDRVWKSIQRELDWVSNNGWQSNTCDLWEEVQSNDFFWNRYTMRKSLKLGSDFAKSMGDADRASKYANTAQSIESALSGHIQSDGFVIESNNRQRDTATIEAFNVGDMGDGKFAPLSREAIATLTGLAGSFCNEYPALNKQGEEGVLFGRYPGDTYEGGNPWVLLTASAATLMYRQAAAMAAGGSISDANAEEALKTFLGQDVSVDSLLGGGDALLNRMRQFLTNGLHMNEQIDKNDGHLRSAKDLTWNYANVLKAMKARAAVKTTSPVFV